MKRFKVTIGFTTPYLQHRMDDVKLEDWEKNRKQIIERDDVAKPDALRADYHSYFDDDGYYMPADHLRGSLINAGGMVKSKVGNARKSMKNIVAASFMVPNDIRIDKWDGIDKRSAVNKHIKARIMVIRPKWNGLKVSFDLLVNNDTITRETILEIVQDAGQYIGVGSYRPEHNGMFGQFEVLEFKELK